MYIEKNGKIISANIVPGSDQFAKLVSVHPYHHAVSLGDALQRNAFSPNAF